MGETWGTTPNELLTERLRDALAELTAKGTADAIAAYLVTQGCQGVRHASGRCPVKVWLSRRLPGVDLMVHSATVWAQVGDSERVYVTSPFPIATFVASYDRGSYPELDAAMTVAR